jgi:hypothetical protein
MMVLVVLSDTLMMHGAMRDAMRDDVLVMFQSVFVSLCGVSLSHCVSCISIVLFYSSSPDPFSTKLQVIETIKTNPTDRRILLSAWNPKVSLLVDGICWKVSQ